jgi:uncharacterized phage-associated protein
MSCKTYSASDVANFFLSLVSPEDNDISNLKLQKLCYYAQGIVSAVRGVPLFNEEIQAWEHGPVVPSLYRRFKCHGSEPITPVESFDDSLIDKFDRGLLRDVYEYYAQFSAWRLRCMTHDESPWIEARDTDNRRISVERLVEHFKPMLSSSYVKKKKRERAAAA